MQDDLVYTFPMEEQPQTVIAENNSSSPSAVSKHIHAKLTGREKCVRNTYTSTEMTAAFRLQLDWNCCQWIKSHHTQKCLRKGLQKCLTWDKEKTSWTVAQCFICKSRSLYLEKTWRSTEVQCNAVSPLCFIKFKVNTADSQDILEHFMLLLANFMDSLISFSSMT